MGNDVPGFQADPFVLIGTRMREYVKALIAAAEGQMGNALPVWVIRGHGSGKSSER